MSFAESFIAVREKRRIPMREFEPINASYIHSVEKDGLLPSPQRLDELLSKMGDVALEQGCSAETIEDERNMLRASWAVSHLERVGFFSPEFIAIAEQLVQLDEERQGEVAQAVEAILHRN